MTESYTHSPEATVLLIDGDDATAAAVHAGLISAGYAVPRAESASEALLALESTHADVILMSLMLPDTDGLVLCSTLKDHFPAPIIVMAPHTGEVDRALALQSGAFDCLSMPVDRDELLAQVTAGVRSPASVEARGRSA